MEYRKDLGLYHKILFASFAVLVFAAKFGVLNTPFHWDEIGWVNAAHWFSENGLYRSMPGLYPKGLIFGHPPLLSLTAAALYKVFGESVWLTHLSILPFSFIGMLFTYLIGEHFYGRRTGILAALFLFFSPVYFAQSGMFLGDLPVAALGAASVYFMLKKRYGYYLAASLPMVLIKETGITIVIAILAYMLLAERKKAKAILPEILKYGVPLLVIAIFFVIQKAAAGRPFFIVWDKFKFFVFGLRNIKLFFMITEWIFFSQLRFVFTILICLNLFLHDGSERRKELLLFSLIILFSGYSFSFLFFLPRYLMSVLPFISIMGAWSFTELVRTRALRDIAGAAMVIMLALSMDKAEDPGTGECTMKYLDIVNVQKAISRFIEEGFPGSAVLTAWPQAEELSNPYLGYVDKPVKTVRSAGQDGFDLILYSAPSSDGKAALRKYALKNGFSLIRRLEGRGGIVAELYGRNYIADGSSLK
ncbi:MAG: glycosyltransferase family 39 protein [Candidatus Omnitrophota bacterium]